MRISLVLVGIFAASLAAGCMPPNFDTGDGMHMFFHPILFETGPGVRQPSDTLGRGEIQQIHIRYAVYSVAPDAWPKLEPRYRPTSAP